MKTVCEGRWLRELLHRLCHFSISYLAMTLGTLYKAHKSLEEYVR